MSNPQEALQDAGRQIAQELEAAEKLRSDPEAGLRDREKLVSESLEKAQALYRKKDYGRAFAEWDQVCALLGENDEFRRQVRELKESHENLLKVNRELAEIKEVLRQRSAPSPSDAKFVSHANEDMNGQVKNVYAYLGQQLRAERTPGGGAAWRPAAAAVVILALGFAGLFIYHGRAQRNAEAREALGPAFSPVDEAFIEAQRRAMEKQVDALDQDHKKEIEDLRRRHAEASKNDRERIVQLETKLNEAESRNSDLERQVKALFEDNVSKDSTLASLS